MGQYYKALIGRTNGKNIVYDPMTHGSWLKLTEHSWWENGFVNALSRSLRGRPARVAWVGDYAEDEPKSQRYNLYGKAYRFEDNTDDGLFADVENVENLSGMYLVNHTKGVFLYCDGYFANSTFRPSWSDCDWCIHPLPILTAVGNGKGGGDYFGINEKDVGSWCWDLISLEDSAPDDYEEVYCFFREDI